MPLVLGWGGPAGTAAGVFASLNQRQPSTALWSEISHPRRVSAA
jgi:hypothetical protein